MPRGLLPCLFALALLAGCVMRPPEAELRAYTAAFQQAESATDAMVETFAPIERRNGAEQNRGKGEGVIDRETAPYYATVGLPPLCAAVDRGFDVLARYNELLVLYAEGRSFEEVRPSLDSFTTSVQGLAAMAGATAGGPLGGVAAKMIDVVLEPAKQLLAAARTVTDRQRLGAFILETDELVLQLLAAERDAGANLLSQAVVDIRRAEPDDFAKQRKLTDEFRVAIANWMGLLGRVEDAFHDLVAAVERGSGSGAQVAALAAWTQELSISAASVRAAVIAASATR